MIIYCGDSHTRPFAFDLFEHKESDPLFLDSNIVWQPGATAGGFPRQNARRGLSSAFRAAFDAKKPDVVCFNLGQVDVDIGFYYASMINDALVFEDWVSKRFEDDIIFCKSIDVAVLIKGLNPTCLISDVRIQSYVRRNTKVSFETGAAFRKAFKAINGLMQTEQHADRNVVANEILKDLCAQHDLTFFDIRAFAGSSGHPGIARDEFVMPRLDVHLSDSLALRSAYRLGLVESLRSIGLLSH